MAAPRSVQYYHDLWRSLLGEAQMYEENLERNLQLNWENGQLYLRKLGQEWEPAIIRLIEILKSALQTLEERENRTTLSTLSTPITASVRWVSTFAVPAVKKKIELATGIFEAPITKESAGMAAGTAEASASKKRAKMAAGTAMSPTVNEGAELIAGTKDISGKAHIETQENETENIIKPLTHYQEITLTLMEIAGEQIRLNQVLQETMSEIRETSLFAEMFSIDQDRLAQRRVVEFQNFIDRFPMLFKADIRESLLDVNNAVCYGIDIVNRAPKTLESIIPIHGCSKFGAADIANKIYFCFNPDEVLNCISIASSNACSSFIYYFGDKRSYAVKTLRRTVEALEREYDSIISSKCLVTGFGDNGNEPGFVTHVNKAVLAMRFLSNQYENPDRLMQTKREIEGLFAERTRNKA